MPVRDSHRGVGARSFSLGLHGVRGNEKDGEA